METLPGVLSAAVLLLALIFALLATSNPKG